ncbi:MAG: ribose 5-phosphate isomerase B [Proteobacteria bacterium]|nr:ribose 5-phosphate isomerase B [Pseudomonadota bacterium]MDA0846133.1 ribose 5-phosphate isomerase B [Pseudomonadota bacterium]
MTIYFASDHAGISLRQTLLSYVQAARHDVVDLGTEETASVDYPDFGVKLAMALKQDHEGRGIAICGSGIGISIALNRFSWVRAALVSQPEAAELARQHNDANVLALGERLITAETAKASVQKFLSTEFEGGRHQRRVDKLSHIVESAAN